MSTERGTSVLTEEQIDHILQSLAGSFSQQLRSPVLHWPSEHDLDYEDVTFPALEGCHWRAGSSRPPGRTS